MWRIGEFLAKSRLIAPVSFQCLNECIRGLDPCTAKEVIMESGTQFLIVSPPSAMTNKDIENIERIATLEMLIGAMRDAGRDHIILNNTARSIDANQTYRRAEESSDMLKALGLEHRYLKVEAFSEITVDGMKTMVPESDAVRVASIALLVHPESYFVMPYIGRDLPLALELQRCGAAAIRLYAGYIGLNRGFDKTVELELSNIIRKLKIPVIIEGGIGRPEHAQRAMEIGADAVLVNNAITAAKDPSSYAKEFKEAVEIGRENYLRNTPEDRIRKMIKADYTYFPASRWRVVSDPKTRPKEMHYA